MRTLTTLLLVLALGAPALAAPPIPPSEMKDHLWDYPDRAALAAQLDGRMATKMVRQEDTKVRGGLSMGVVDAPIDKVMMVVKDYERYKKLLRFFTRSMVLGKDGGKTKVHVKISIAKGTVKLWANVDFQESSRGDIRIVEAGLVKGNMKRMDARWELAPVDENHTLVQLRLLVDPDMALASNAKATEMNQVNARRAIRSVRKQVKRY